MLDQRFKRLNRRVLALIVAAYAVAMSGEARSTEGQTAEKFTRASAYFPAGDTKRGQELAVTCQACHVESADPIGDPPIHAPRLRHQRMTSIFYALQDYKAGQRDNTVMGPVAAELSDQDMRDLAVYLAGPRLALPPKPVLSAVRDLSGSICGFCHGDTGLGMMDGYPVLAGQHRDYLEKALADYRSGVRTNPTMSVIARQLTEQQTQDLANYFSSYAALESIP